MTRDQAKHLLQPGEYLYLIPLKPQGIEFSTGTHQAVALARLGLTLKDTRRGPFAVAYRDSQGKTDQKKTTIAQEKADRGKAALEDYRREKRATQASQDELAGVLWLL